MTASSLRSRQDYNTGYVSIPDELLEAVWAKKISLDELWAYCFLSYYNVLDKPWENYELFPRID